MTGRGWGRVLASNRAQEGEEGEEEAYGSFWSGEGLSVKLSGDVSVTFSSTMASFVVRNCPQNVECGSMLMSMWRDTTTFSNCCGLVI